MPGTLTSASLPNTLAALLEPSAYPHPVAGVELVTTHISWVLLAGEYAYKIKRPVRYPFIDLTSLERRRFLCQEEVRLNRRFAPELYLGVCRVVRTEGAARMEAPDSASAPASGFNEAILDHAVGMRRFSRAEELDRLLDDHRIAPHELETFGHELARIHASFPAASVCSSWGRPEDIEAQLLRNLLECADAAAVFDSSEQILALRDRMQTKLAASTAWMAARRSSGRIRECHGDLHSRNIVRVRGRLLAFDCLEYEPAWRWIDTADEMAFLTSDLQARGRPLHAHAFRGGYLAESGDYHGCRLLGLYEAHRALVRAKVAALAAQAGQPDAAGALRGEHLRLVTFAAGALEPKMPRLLLMSGLSGSGKTWLARQLAERLSAVHVRSDVERKRHAGLRELAVSHSRPGEDLYSEEVTATVYADLAQAAENVLGGGIATIVDATFLKRAWRARFAELAARCGAALHLIVCEASEPVLRARIEARGRAGRDASEADLGVLTWQLAHAEAPTADEGIDAIRVNTARADALDLTMRSIGAVPADVSHQA
ncbi:MAG TPA: AAA family ATPase [Steroidobacteraceae bacterium]|nr:AAA family ATPase [Steroidobacteraceae bacterium]